MSDPLDTQLTRRGLIVLGGTAIAVTAVRGAALAPPALGADAEVPTFESVNGFAPGDRQATSDQLESYVRLVAAASPRVQTALLKPGSIEGRPLRYAIVSHPANLSRLASIERRTRALRLRPPSPSSIPAAVERLPAFVNVVANVHGNEPSGADALAQLLYELASRNDDENLVRLRELVLVLMLVQNPDGRDAGRRVNANAFDLNRDWFAFTQPETVGKVGLFSRFPPVLGIDMHEQFASAPGTFFFPPDNDPVHHESSRAGLKASNETITPAISAAFDAEGYSYEHYGIYDVFYPGYGDIAPNQAFGAAGVLFEVENTTSYPEKVARQFTAADASVNAAAAHRQALLTAWARQWPAAVAQGRRGKLAPNLRQNPANPEPRPVPGERIYGYALTIDRHVADVAHLVDRLRAFDVQVHVLRRPLALTRLRPFGATEFAPARLPTGTIVVRSSQPMKHWVQILLADDPFPSVNYFYDVAGWANPAMMGLQGGAIGEPIRPLLAPRRHRVKTVREVHRARELQRPLPNAAALSFALDSAFAQSAAFALMDDGVELRRDADGIAYAAGSARGALAAAGRRYGIRVGGAAAIPQDATPVRRPRVALYHDVVAEQTETYFASSSGFAGWLLGTRFGLDVEHVDAVAVETGRLASGFDALVVPDGISTVIPAGVPNVAVALPGGGLSPAGLANVQAFVAGGGTFVGYRTLGIAVARAAGIAGDLTTVAAPSGFTVPGCPVGVDVLEGDPATLGLVGRSFSYNVNDPILEGGEQTIVRYPDQLVALGYEEQLDAINGTVAGTVAHVGSGSAYVFSFDPAYRGFVEGTQRLVGNTLLAPPASAARGTARAVDPALLTDVVTPLRMHVVRVSEAGSPALRAALDGLDGLPGDALLEPAPGGGLQLRAIDRDPLSGHAAAWQVELLTRLARAGAVPTLVVA